MSQLLQRFYLPLRTRFLSRRDRSGEKQRHAFVHAGGSFGWEAIHSSGARNLIRPTFELRPVGIATSHNLGFLGSFFQLCCSRWVNKQRHKNTAERRTASRSR